MRRLLGALTVRGRSFVAAGAAAIVCGLLIPEPDLLRIGALLMALPLLSAFGAGPGQVPAVLRAPGDPVPAARRADRRR